MTQEGVREGAVLEGGGVGVGDTDVVVVLLIWCSRSLGPSPKACRSSVSRLVKSAVLGVVPSSRSI